MKRLGPGAIVLIMLMAAMVPVIVISMSMEYFGSRLLPIVMAGTIFVLSAAQLKKEISASSAQTTGQTGDFSAPGQKDVSLRKYLPFVEWVAGFTVALFLTGITVASFLLVLSYMKTHGSGWIMAFVSAAAFAAIIYLGFGLALGSDLYRGVLFGG